MSDTILVPLDGSSLAGRAVPYATALARATGARLVLLWALSPRELSRTLDHRPDPAAELQDAVDLVRSEGVEAEPYLSTVYFPTEVPGAIVDAAREHQAWMIVMSTHGRGGLGRWMFGSVADAVLRRAEVPVLLISATCERTWPTGRPRRILVPLDGSLLAAQALEPASELARATGAEVLLLRVIDLPGPEYAAMYGAYEADTMIAEAHKSLDPIVARLLASGVTAAARFEVGSPERVIAEIAHRDNVDLVAMATHGRGGLSRVVLGSVATGVLQRTTVPLLLVRPTAAQTVTTTAAAVAGQPVVSLSLTDKELDLVQRGLQELAYAPGHPAELAQPARALLDRLKGVEPAGATRPPTESANASG